MAITKTKFIQLMRCPRYAGLENLNAKDLTSKMTFAEYKKEEQAFELQELLETLSESSSNSNQVNEEHLKVMLPYYNEVEQLAGIQAKEYFDGIFTYARNTKDQECFEFKRHGILYLCYVDIYNETDDGFRIIEAKATTSAKFLNLGSTKTKNGKRSFTSIFQKGKDGIYYLLEDTDVMLEEYMPKDKYIAHREKLMDRYHAAGHYVYDLAVQRYFIEQDLKKDQLDHMIPNLRYYLAVLNHEYVFDGTLENGKPVYHKDQNGNDIICYFDMTSITSRMMPMIERDRKTLEERLKEPNVNPCPIGIYCEHKKTTKCKYCDICWKRIPKENSVFQFIDQHHGFQKEDGTKVSTYELANQGIVRQVDVPDSYLKRKKNQIQKEVVLSHTPYIDIEKIKDGIKEITYPIYHLDFETFPCPLPRYRNERCYTQSVFQFSLHIEKEAGVCDKIKDHYEYLAPDHLDHREELVKKLCSLIDTESGGTVLVYNDSFEKTRLLELANTFPEYREQLLKIREMIFDLMNLLKGSTALYKKLGYDSESSNMFNYYHEKMTGSFSIKKILPLFSSLTYQGMEVGNGMEALITYAQFPTFTKEEYEHKYQKMIEYCRQDTWAMVEILHGLSKSVN